MHNQYSIQTKDGFLLILAHNEDDMRAIFDAIAKNDALYKKGIRVNEQQERCSFQCDDCRDLIVNGVAYGLRERIICLGCKQYYAQRAKESRKEMIEESLVSRAIVVPDE